MKGRPTIEIAHPPGAEVQWDWVELPEAPWGGTAHVLVGSLPFSGKFRAVFADGEDQAHLIWAMHRVLERLGGTARCWRVDRMTTVIVVGGGDVQPNFVPVARHYGVTVVACPPRRGNRKGVGREVDPLLDAAMVADRCDLDDGRRAGGHRPVL